LKRLKVGRFGRIKRGPRGGREKKWETTEKGEKSSGQIKGFLVWETNGGRGGEKV